ncbi:hypothetical protein D3C72_2206560 [compost metagenome]
MATGRPAGNPQSAAMDGSNEPITVPLGTMGGSARGTRSARPATSKANVDQVPVASDSRPAVLASLASVAMDPVSRKPR